MCESPNLIGQKVLLLYIVCDESGSMGPNGGIAAILAKIATLRCHVGPDIPSVGQCMTNELESISRQVWMG